jgi:hypothetical protein
MEVKETLIGAFLQEGEVLFFMEVKETLIGALLD